MAKNKKGDLSPALQIADIFWSNCSQRGGEASYAHLESAMKHAVILAIDFGLEFGQDDFKIFEKKYMMGHWAATPGNPDEVYAEGFYSRASKARNVSACRSFEKFRGREPYILGGKRICVGAKFHWNGEEVECTSFPNGKDYLVACSYKTPADGRRINHIYKIKRSDLKGLEKRTKPRDLERQVSFEKVWG